jgi:hypothetical protein
MTHDRAVLVSLPVLSARFQAGVGPASLAAAIALLAATAPLSADVIELAPAAPQEAGDFGFSVSGVPDINGDGFDDVIVGAPDEDHFGVTGTGRVAIYSGKTGALLRQHFSPNATTLGLFGRAVVGVEDLNGDGRGDYLVGAYNEASGGRAYLYSGANGSLLRTITSPNAQAGSAFGASMAGVPDLTGDGVMDYIIGAPQEAVNGLGGAGRAYVFNGASGALVRTVTSPNPDQGGGFGHSVAGATDTGGDGRGDYAIGAPFEEPAGAPTDSGRAYAYSGGTGLLLRSYLPSTPNLLGWYGWCVAAVPDLNGDTLSELVIGSPNEDVPVGKQTPNNNAGAIEILAFGPGTFFRKIAQPAADVSDDNQFGFSVAPVPDVNGPGKNGFIVGAPGDQRAYLYGVDNPGSPAELLETLSTPDATGIDQRWGNSVACAGDANGDGRGDYIIGGPGSDNFPTGPAGSGRAYLHRPVYNDGCGTVFAPAQQIQSGSNQVSTIGANAGAGISGCGGWQNPGPDTWYRYTATCDGVLKIDTCGAGFDTLLAVYDGCNYTGQFFLCDLSVLLACSDDAPNCSSNGSRIELNVSSGECFFIRLAGFDGESGAATMTVTMLCDACLSDLNGDGVVNAADLSAVLGAWGTAAGDVNNDGITNANDIATLLGAWGACN